MAMDLLCGHVGPKLVWLREDGQMGSGNIQFLRLCAWARVFAVPEVTGNCRGRSFHQAGGLMSESQQPFSGVGINRSMIACINVLFNML